MRSATAVLLAGTPRSVQWAQPALTQPLQSQSRRPSSSRFNRGVGGYRADEGGEHHLGKMWIGDVSHRPAI